MANARRASQGLLVNQMLALDDGQVVSGWRRWQRMSRPPQRLPPRRLVPSVLIGRCFNYLQPDHFVAGSPNASRYLWYQRECHQACSCKWPRSSDVVGPLMRAPRVASEVVVHPGTSPWWSPRTRRGVLAAPRAQHARTNQRCPRWRVHRHATPYPHLPPPHTAAFITTEGPQASPML
jgi:hypothetical protein